MDTCTQCGEPLNTAKACPKCSGGEYTYIMGYYKQIPTGWLCPRCNKINAPWVQACNCGEGITTTTYGPTTVSSGGTG